MFYKEFKANKGKQIQRKIYIFDSDLVRRMQLMIIG